MAKILWNKQGDPLMAYGKTYFATTTGAPKEVEPVKPVEELDSTEIFNQYTVSPWGSGNDFPVMALDIIGRTGVLNTGLKYIRNFTMGQGIFPVRVTGYNDKGDEILEVINDPKITSFLEGRIVRRYMANALRDYFKLGISFAELIANADGSQIVGINTINAQHCRLTQAEGGSIKNCIIHGNWPDPPSEAFKTLPILDNYDPESDLISRRIAGRTANKSFVYLIRDEWGNEDYYPLPAWYSAYRAGWIDIANQVPIFLKRAYSNQISWLWHIKIPYAYWDKRYPKSQHKDEVARMALIQRDMDEIEGSLTGTANANKAIFSHYAANAQGKPEEMWYIEPLDNKYKEGDKLITSAAANSEILFSLMINPNVLGAGMPGGTYAGNQGGSNIREAFLVNIANAWLDRQNILDPIEAYLGFNGVKDVQLRFRNTILTTLDTGAGTQKQIN
ncbi:MAG: hypothetical protein WC699_13195 [Bacteroidales bacterium]|jgi:hypothetical protein|nr:hypothetical protein [Ignavibacteriaceae bacterium]